MKSKIQVHKFGLLAALYLSQGLPYGFFTQALPVLMRQQGISLAAIGLSSLLALPWALKFLWAPWVDRYGWQRLGRRRSWILPIQGLSILLMLSLSPLDPGRQLPWIMGAVLLINLLAATQDIATDGWAVELLSPKERGLGNGVQVGAYRLGMIIGGGVILMILERLGWSYSFFLMAGLLLLMSLPPLLSSEAPSKESLPIEGTFSSIWGYFQAPGRLPWILILIAYKSFDALASPMVKPMMVDQGYLLAEIGALLGAGGSIAGLLGALLGGLGVLWLGKRRALLLFGLLQVIAVSFYLLPAQELGGTSLLLGAVCADHLFGSMATTALFTLMMDHVRPGQAGADYSLQASVVVITTGLSASLSGFSAQALGFSGHFLLSTLLSLLGLLLVWALYRSADICLAKAEPPRL